MKTEGEKDPFFGFDVESLDVLFKSGRAREVLVDSVPEQEPVNKEDMKFLKNHQKKFIEMMMGRLAEMNVRDLRESSRLFLDDFRPFKNLFKTMLSASQRYLEDEMTLAKMAGLAKREFERWQKESGAEQMYTPEHKEAQKKAEFWQRAEDVITAAWELGQGRY